MLPSIVKAVSTYLANSFTFTPENFEQVPDADDAVGELPVVQLDNRDVGPATKLNRQEKSDGYDKVVFHVDELWRVIVCKNGIQWILQKRKGSHDGRTAWRGIGFARSRDGLRRAIRLKIGDISPEVEAHLAQLPDWVES